MTLVVNSGDQKLMVIDATPEDVCALPEDHLGDDYLTMPRLKLYDVVGYTDADELEVENAKPLFIGKATLVFAAAEATNDSSTS